MRDFFISYFYYFANDIRYPKERPELLWLGLVLSLSSFILGRLISKKNTYTLSFKSLKDGALAVVITWVVACSISSIVFVEPSKSCKPFYAPSNLAFGTLHRNKRLLDKTNIVWNSCPCCKRRTVRWLDLSFSGATAN